MSVIEEPHNLAQQPVDRASSIIYEYLLQCAAKKSPDQVIQELKSLLVQGRNANAQASQALEKIIFDPAGQRQFPTILSCCFYLIIDCWTKNPESLSYLAKLMAILELVNQSKSYDRRRKQLIQLIKDYQQSTPYIRLQGVISIIDPQAINNIALARATKTNEVDVADSDAQALNVNTIKTYLPRYTYLYGYLLPNELKLGNLQQYLGSIQSKRQKNFEIQLAKHIIYRFRLKQVAKMKLISQGAGKIITKVKNPTLLSERAFRTALQQYSGTVDDGSTILKRSQRFIADNKTRSSYLVFKRDLYRFLISSIKLRNKQDNFFQELEQKLEETFVQSDHKPVNNTLVLQTCRQLFSFLITDSNSSSNPHRFANFVANLGTAQVMMILIKITLICPDAQADLEKKIFLVTTQYQSHTVQDAPWLFKILEHLLMAFSIYYGDIDISLAKSVIGKS